MSRAKKLLAVGLILGIGVGLALPFRKTAPPTTNALPAVVNQPESAFTTTLSTATHASQADREQDSQTRHIVAKMASTSEQTPATTGMASFDLANHPALADQHTVAAALPVTPTPPSAGQKQSPLRKAKPTARPAYATSDSPTLSEADDGPVEVLHIVRNADTLEKLAERYLGDGGLALEIFDLNRDQLENPHLLPIGAKLRIPVDPARMID